MEPEMERAVARTRATWAAFAELRPMVEAGAPWPLAERFGAETEAAWGPPELLAHLEEMLPYWLGEVERILDGGQDPAPFGRVPTDPVRLGIIERDRAVPLRELFSRTEADIERFARRIATLTGDDLARVGRHPRRGEMTVAEVLEAFVVSHLEEHVVQLREILGAAP